MQLPPPVHHIAVLVTDLDRAERFYGGVLALPVKTRWNDDAGEPRSIWFELGGGAFLAIERASEARPKDDPENAPRWHCVALGIEPTLREAWRAVFEKAGHPVERETLYTLYVRDPDGNVLALSHYPQRADRLTIP